MRALTPRSPSQWQLLAPGTRRRWKAAHRTWRSAEAAYVRGEHLTARQRGHGTGARTVTPRDLGQLRPSQRAARRRSLEAIDKMRPPEGLSLKQAASQAHTTPDAVLRYGGPTLHKDAGRWRAKPSDRLVRRQLTTIIEPGTGRQVEAVVETASSKQASEIGRQNSDVGAWLSARTSPPAKRAARARLEGRHGKQAGRRAFLPDGGVVDYPRFYGDPYGLIELSEEIDLGDLDYGSDQVA